ncbi:hypothetical protein EGN72_01960 [Pseudorhodobacter sp. E13]|uniref:C1 family peptidase n=1 Tax=Pseudorhodobacter sp. E13 TaxID=2487931 RepID=UPI000F8DE3B2|nr:C1 family peptidase [Pseudorhodobacter sp. E13]RUS65006.1 hypothetical protein EGN72_01960 [Pseudorhodobacter sp. E13]
MTLRSAGFGSALPASVREYFNAAYAASARARSDDDALRVPPVPVIFSAQDGASWPVKDQGERATCSAFAAVAMMERFRAKQGEKPEHLSEQFLYYLMRHTLSSKQNPAPGAELGATRLSEAREVLEGYGVCASDHLTYGAKATADINGEPPSPAAFSDAQTRLHRDFDSADYPTADKRVPGLAKRLHAILLEGRPVAVAVPTFMIAPKTTNWKAAQAGYAGIVYCPIDAAVASAGMDPTPDNGHAVCLVGFQVDPSEPLGGWFMFRNSWNSYFATRPDEAGTPFAAPAVGYGVLSATQIEHYVWEFLSAI